MDIDQLMARFAVLPGARVGSGPRHPTHPDPALEERVAQFFDELPALSRDPGYVDFMWRYAGASRSDAARRDFFEIYGFSDAAPTFDEFEEPMVDDDGSFMFAEAVVHERRSGRLDTYSVGFAFNVDQTREWAVYSAVQEKSVERPFTKRLRSFTEFLAEAVEMGTHYPRLPTASGRGSSA
jgi:hypothetical protein